MGGSIPLKDFEKVHLLVAGEVGIDEYLWGDTRRISPEAPVPVVEVDSQTSKLGLAANVAQNVASLGGRVTLVSVRGTDEEGKRIESMIDEAGISRRVLMSDSTRPTLRKVRVIAQKQHVVRVDYERSHALDINLARQFNENICDLIPSCDGVIVQDYGKGLWNPDTMAFVKHAKAHGRPVFVDPSRTSLLSLYRGATLLSPNTVEAEILCGLPPASSKAASRDQSRLRSMGNKILAETAADHAVITCGEAGMVAVSGAERRFTHIPTFARDVFDVTGAGDTVIAVLSLMMVLGHPLERCMEVANAAAGIVVGQIGAASVKPMELQTELERLGGLGLIQG